jgi:hypothetical protein
MPLAPSLTLEYPLGDTHQALVSVYLELEDSIFCCQGEVEDVHRNLLLCVVPISTEGNDCQGNRTPGTAWLRSVFGLNRLSDFHPGVMHPLSKLLLALVLGYCVGSNHEAGSNVLADGHGSLQCAVPISAGGNS